MTAFILFITPVKHTASYVTSLSNTCENTFVGETKTNQPEKPDKDETTSPKGDKKTGDDTTMEWYLLGMVSSLLAIAILTKWKLKIKYKLN